MPREFNITTSVSTVSLDSTGRGEITFTVSNAVATPMRALASLQPSPPLKAEWLSLRRSGPRDMPPGSTEVFIVDVQVPPGAPRGPFTFRLVVADEALPDERFTEGPAVSVEVSAPVPVPAKSFPWVWLVLGALVLLGGAVAAAVALGDDTPPEGVQCTSGQTLCEGQCVDLQADARHCGRCSKPCDESFDCRAGQCVRTGCPAGQSLCEGQCIDTRGDEKNCGACGKSCEAHLLCRDGRCACPGTLSSCGNQCIDTTTDEQNCGSCGNRCGAGQVCRNGACQCTTAGTTACSGQCVNTRTDGLNCGGCGIRCAPGLSCQNGSCQCGSGLTLCAGACVNPQTSAQHCGRCNSACVSTQRCEAGTCRCPAGQTLCGNQCVSLTTKLNCGRCGNRCTATQSCTAGRCVTSNVGEGDCPAGRILCDCTGDCVSPNVCNRICSNPKIDTR